MSRLVLIIIAAVIVISLTVVGYVLRKPMKKVCKKVWSVAASKGKVVSDGFKDGLAG